MRGSHPAGNLLGTRILELERNLDVKLRSRIPDKPLDPSLQSAVREWSATVWAAAQALGPSALRSSELDRGVAFARRPVFVCGAARSGTTLLRDLLDGHPQLVVVPTESLYYTFLERALFAMRSDQHSSYLGCRWLERLIAPPPYWLLGPSLPGGSPYVTFARNFAAWWQVPDGRKDARISSWPIAALALAYAQQLGAGTIPSSARMWVEKTPSSERFLPRIWRDFPEARVLHIVRRPEDVLASLKALAPHKWGHGAAVQHCVRYLAPSYRIAAARARELPQDRYRLIRYENLTADPETAMRRIAEFLGIEPLPLLLQPTVTGRTAMNNSSFGRSRQGTEGSLDRIERLVLALTVARSAGQLGYGPETPLSSASRSVVGAGGAFYRSVA